MLLPSYRKWSWVICPAVWVIIKATVTLPHVWISGTDWTPTPGLWEGSGKSTRSGVIKTQAQTAHRLLDLGQVTLTSSVSIFLIWKLGQYLCLPLRITMRKWGNVIQEHQCNVPDLMRMHITGGPGCPFNLEILESGIGILAYWKYSSIWKPEAAWDRNVQAYWLFQERLDWVNGEHLPLKDRKFRDQCLGSHVHVPWGFTWADVWWWRGWGTHRIKWVSMFSSSPTHLAPHSKVGLALGPRENSLALVLSKRFPSYRDPEYIRQREIKKKEKEIMDG